MNGTGQVTSAASTVSAVGSGAMNAIGQAAPAITGGIIGFGVGGPPGAVAGFALGAGLAERVFLRAENRAAKVADNVEQELINGTRRVIDATVGVISHYGDLWGPIYLGYMGMGGFETAAHRSYDWYNQNCDWNDSTVGNPFDCHLSLVYRMGLYVLAGAAAAHTYNLLHQVLKGQSPLFQEKKS